MNAPASRLTDRIICPKHGYSMGPVLSPGATEVLIGGLTAARYTDACQCATPHRSPLAEGAAMVLINGLPAARVGVQTLDGGQIVDGDASVLFGGDSFSLPTCFTIERDKDDEDYQAQVLLDLYRVGSSPSGKRLFESIAASGHKVRFHPGSKVCSATSDPLHKGYGGVEGMDDRATDGTGIDSSVSYNPSRANEASAKLLSPDGRMDAGLYHELVHSDDITHGRLDRRQGPNPGGSWLSAEHCERRAVGLPPYDNEQDYPYSENIYRRERGYPRRAAY